MATQNVHYMGNGPISFELPSRGRRYTFKPKIRNTVEADVWAELIDPVSGPARLYVKAKKLRPTTAGGGADVEETASVSRAIAPAAPAPMPSQDPVLREENTRLRAEVKRLSARLDALDKAPAPMPSQDPVKPEPPAEDEADAESNKAESDAALDPHSMSVGDLEQAIKGMGLEALEALLAAEQDGKARKGAVAAIEAEIDRALKS